MEIYRDIIEYVENKKARHSLRVLDQTMPNLGHYNLAKQVIDQKLIQIDNISQRYGATLTLKKKYHNDDPLYMHRLIEKKILGSHIWKNKKYIMFAEFTKKGIIHYHGIFYNMYQIEFIKMMNWWKRIFGHVKIEIEIRHYDCWIKYITKDQGKTGLWTLYNIERKLPSESEENDI